VAYFFGPPCIVSSVIHKILQPVQHIFNRCAAATRSCVWRNNDGVIVLTGSIPVYVYTPTKLASDDAPILIYYHGGGMVVGSRENVETTCQILSK